MAEREVSIVGSTSQLETALRIQRQLNIFNAGRRTKVSAMFLGGVALNRYRKLWLSSETHLIDSDLSQLIPAADQFLEIGLYISRDPEGQDRRRGVELIQAAANALRSDDRQDNIVLHLLLEEQPFVLPFGARVPIGSSPHEALPQNCIGIVHPATFLMKTLKQIVIQQVWMDDPTRPHELNSHRNSRNAQIRLLRIFVELIIAAGRSDRKRYDTVSRRRIRQTDLGDLCRYFVPPPGSHQAEMFNTVQASEEANWEAGIRGRQEDAAHIGRLRIRNLTAFAWVKNWIDRPQTQDQHALTGCFDFCEPSLPRYEVLSGPLSREVSMLP